MIPSRVQCRRWDHALEPLPKIFDQPPADQLLVRNGWALFRRPSGHEESSTEATTWYKLQFGYSTVAIACHRLGATRMPNTIDSRTRAATQDLITSSSGVHAILNSCEGMGCGPRSSVKLGFSGTPHSAFLTPHFNNTVENPTIFMAKSWNNTVEKICPPIPFLLVDHDLALDQFPAEASSPSLRFRPGPRARPSSSMRVHSGINCMDLLALRSIAGRKRFMDCGWLRLWILSSVFICSGLTSSGADSRADISKNMRPAVDAAIVRVAPALVRIRVVSTSYADGREVKSQAVGSGAIITKEGHVISNHHVAGRAVRIFCTLSDREEIEAELIGTDPLTDICIIQLTPSKPRVFPTVGFGDSGKLRVGDPVLALGSPMALSQSVTLGIISNLEMVMPRFFGPSGRLRQEGEDVGSLVRWIAHDAQIYGGNSGGPLVNLAGEIVGIKKIRIGLSGAIPGNLARP